MRGNIFSRYVLQPAKYIMLGTEPFIFNDWRIWIQRIQEHLSSISQASDLAGEQTYMRNTKAAGFLLSPLNLSSFVYLK